MKTCTKCKRNLSDSEFNKRTRNKSGLRSECRECQSAMSKGYFGPAKPKPQSKTKYLKMRVNGVNIPVHRHIMEKIIGRPLLSSEAVHHINGDKHDNRPENLEIMPIPTHSRITNVGREWSEEVKAKVSKSLIGNQRRKGIPHSDEIKTLLSSLLIGNKRRAGISPKNKGKKFGPDGHYH